ncbi:hypothetical protein KP509_38G019800 [Ceratopteris richardii]|uniref:Uncharacterized protein n=1 Tax=Ceratopteris richardii TaxID=49495 RepID=A0A8T2Q2V2_CERRI|nr:hypothetical protein KP509_38G019800 [Ceratopteris richardii]
MNSDGGWLHCFVRYQGGHVSLPLSQSPLWGRASLHSPFLHHFRGVELQASSPFSLPLSGLSSTKLPAEHFPLSVAGQGGSRADIHSLSLCVKLHLLPLRVQLAASRGVKRWLPPFFTYLLCMWG